MRRLERGGAAVRWLLGALLVLLVAAGVGMLLTWRWHWREDHRAWIRGVRTPSTGDEVVDVHPDWVVEKSPLGDGWFRATMILTAVPRETVLEDDPPPEGMTDVGSRSLRVPQGLEGAAPVPGARVSIRLDSAGGDGVTLADGSNAATVTTGADGRASVDVRNGFAHLVATFDFECEDGTIRSGAWPVNLVHMAR